MSIKDCRPKMIDAHSRKQFKICSECHRKTAQDKAFSIDDRVICASCMYAGHKPFKIYPIGVVKNKLKRAQKGFGTVGDHDVSCISLFASQEPFLYKVEEEKYLTVVYYLHESDKVRSVFNRGLDGKKVGVFASRTPYRLSRIAIQDVRLIEVKGTQLYVEGLDAVDGSPVLDIKMKWHRET